MTWVPMKVYSMEPYSEEQLGQQQVNIALDANHIYTVNGVVKPGTTGILDGCGLISDFSKQEFAAQRGEAIHQGGALLFQDRLDWTTVEPRIFGYLYSLEQFRKTTGFKAVTVEQKGYHKLYDYCGKWDVTGLFPWSALIEDDWLIDLKSGVPAKWHKLQTALYQRMAGTKHRGCLYLQPDGSLPKLVEHKDPNDWRAAYAARKLFEGDETYRDQLNAWLEAA